MQNTLHKDEADLPPHTKNKKENTFWAFILALSFFSLIVINSLAMSKVAQGYGDVN